MDTSKQYNQSDLPSDIFNASDGDIKTFNGQQVRVKNNGNGTRSLNPLSPTETAIGNANQIRQYNISANQPAIQTLQNNSTDLKGRYSDLLASIKGQQGVAENAQTTATNNELGRRGITADSGVGAQQIAGALRPIDANYQQLAANTGMSQQNDLNGIASQIASLQTGDPAGALSASGNIDQLTQQAQQIANNYAIQQKQNQYIPLGYGGVYNTANGQTVDSTKLQSIGAGGIYDPMTGQVIQGVKSLSSQLGGGQNPW